MGSSTFSGPITSTAGFITGSASLVDVTANVTLTPASHAGRVMNFNVAAGATATLPAATGTGHVYEFFVQTTVTSNQYRIDVDGTDSMSGVAHVANDGGDTASLFETAADTDRINMNGSTTGGILGTRIKLQDMASGVWSVFYSGAHTGIEATPFVTGAVS